MVKHDINGLIEFDNAKFKPQVLINDPGYRMVLLTLRKGQAVPEHATAGRVTVYAVSGHVHFYEGEVACDLHQGEVVSLAAGAKHKVEALEDSVLLVLATVTAVGADETIAINTMLPSGERELDIREVPRPQRHPLIFAKFDALASGESFQLVNDHDPIPLNRQFESIRPGEASWEYLERGPSLFRIRIKRIAAPKQEAAV
jgi:uncharacterized protein (DUF2249 family)/quercetin dioxygenase-like cupin family protein